MTETDLSEGPQQPDDDRALRDQPGAPGDDLGQARDDHPDTFDRSYVEKLRTENAKHRLKAARADEAIARLLALTIATATKEILADPTDLAPDAALLDEDGFPDLDEIRAAAERLVTVKPHLATRHPMGEIGQGAREADPGPSLGALLRAGAS